MLACHLKIMHIVKKKVRLTFTSDLKLKQLFKEMRKEICMKQK